LKARVQIHICTPMFIAVVFTMAGGWKQPKYNEWINKISST
jgi:hypothetical protein